MLFQRPFLHRLQHQLQNHFLYHKVLKQIPSQVSLAAWSAEFSASLSLGSLSSAVPAVISGLANALDAADVVTRKFSIPPWKLTNKCPEAIANGTVLGTDVPVVVQKLFQAVKPTSTPTSIPQAISQANSAFGITSSSQAPPPEQDILQNVVTLLLDGFTSSDLEAVIQGVICTLIVSKQYSLSDYQTGCTILQQHQSPSSILENFLQHRPWQCPLRHCRIYFASRNLHPTSLHLGCQTTCLDVTRHRCNWRLLLFLQYR